MSGRRGGETSARRDRYELSGDTKSDGCADPGGSLVCRVERVSDSETRLIVPGDELRLPDRHEFATACEKLLEGEAARIVVDLTSLQNIYSLFIGVLVDVALRAREAEKTFVIRARGNVAESLRLMNVDATAQLDIS